MGVRWPSLDEAEEFLKWLSIAYPMGIAQCEVVFSMLLLFSSSPYVCFMVQCTTFETILKYLNSQIEDISKTAPKIIQKSSQISQSHTLDVKCSTTIDHTMSLSTTISDDKYGRSIEMTTSLWTLLWNLSLPHYSKWRCLSTQAKITQLYFVKKRHIVKIFINCLDASFFLGSEIQNHHLLGVLQQSNICTALMQ